MQSDDFGPHINEAEEVLSPVVGCYTMHLYCRNVGSTNHRYKEFPHEIVGENNSECRTIARQMGWIIHQDNYATCPKCSKVNKRNN